MKNKTSKLIVYLFIFALIVSASFLLYKIMHPKPDSPKFVISKYEFKDGETLYKILKSENLNEKQIIFMTKKLEEYVPISKIVPGQTYAIERSTSGVFTSLTYYKDATERYKIQESTTVPLAYEVKVEKDEIKKEEFLLEGTVKTSLYEAIVSQKFGTAALAVEMSEVFAWQIDFFTDPQVGDKFKLVCERFYTDNGYSKIGKILAAEYISKTEKHEAFYFNASYYDRNGNALKKAFLKSPLNYKKISSYFTLSRMHPILKYRRPHQGIDYAAPTGTPIVSIGDGTVIFVGVSGGFGKMVKVRHSFGYESWYGHLSKYGRNIRKGVRVRQGQIICYVGSTGMSTGPHLDFRVKKNNVFLNYLRLKFPPATSVLKSDLDQFNLLAKKYLDILEPVKKAAPANV